MAPARLDTRHVYLPLSSGFRFFKLSVHFFFLCSLASGRVKVWSSFIHIISGRGCPLATHLSRTELPTGRAITRRLILEGCVKRGRAAGQGSIKVSGKEYVRMREEWHCLIPRASLPHAYPTAGRLGPPGPQKSHLAQGSPSLG